MLTPAVALFQQIEEMIGHGCYGDAAGVRAELRSRFGFDVAWRPTASGPAAEVVGATYRRPSSGALQSGVKIKEPPVPAKEPGGSKSRKPDAEAPTSDAFCDPQ